MLRRRPLLVIEDSDDDFEILASCLTAAGVPNQLERCANGTEVKQYLEELKSSPSARHPLFIFLDLNLPGIHGHEVLRRLKSHPVLAATPVVILTTSAQQDDVINSYRLGASGFLTKPVDLDKFENMVKEVANYWFSCVRLPENGGASGFPSQSATSQNPPAR